MAKEPQIVYVTSSPFSGSTMLAMILGCHSSGAALGETDMLMRKRGDGTWRHRKWCTICNDEDGAKCPIFDAGLVRAARENPDRLYELLAEKHPHARFFADASKDLDWWTTRLVRPGARTMVVHVTKSVESYTASLLTRHVLKRPIEFVANDWAQHNKTLRSFAVRAGVPYIHVRYVDLASDLDATLARLGAMIGFEPEPGQRSFWDHPHHYLRGNPGTASHIDKRRAAYQRGLNNEIYTNNHRKIFVDDKWKKVLTPGQVDRIYSLPSVAEECEAYGYPHPLQPAGAPIANRVVSAFVDPGVSLIRWAMRPIRELQSLRG